MSKDDDDATPAIASSVPTKRKQQQFDDDDMVFSLGIGIGLRGGEIYPSKVAPIHSELLTESSTFDGFVQASYHKRWMEGVECEVLQVRSGFPRGNGKIFLFTSCLLPIISI